MTVVSCAIAMLAAPVTRLAATRLMSTIFIILLHKVWTSNAKPPRSIPSGSLRTFHVDGVVLPRGPVLPPHHAPGLREPLVPAARCLCIMANDPQGDRMGVGPFITGDIHEADCDFGPGSDCSGTWRAVSQPYQLDRDQAGGEAGAAAGQFRGRPYGLDSHRRRRGRRAGRGRPGVRGQESRLTFPLTSNAARCALSPSGGEGKKH